MHAKLKRGNVRRAVLLSLAAALACVACVEHGPAADAQQTPKGPKPTGWRKFVDVLGADPYEAAEIAVSAKAESVSVSLGAFRVASPGGSPAEEKQVLSFGGIEYRLSGGRMSSVTVRIQDGPDRLGARRKAYEAIRAVCELRDPHGGTGPKVLVHSGQRGAPEVTVYMSAPEVKGIWTARFEPRPGGGDGATARPKEPAHIVGIPLPFHLASKNLKRFLKLQGLPPVAMLMEKTALSIGQGDSIALDFLRYDARPHEGPITKVVGFVEKDENDKKKLGRFYRLLQANGEIVEEKIVGGDRRVRARIPVSRSRSPGILYVHWEFIDPAADSGPPPPSYFSFEMWRVAPPKAEGSAASDRPGNQ